MRANLKYWEKTSIFWHLNRISQVFTNRFGWNQRHWIRNWMWIANISHFRSRQSSLKVKISVYYSSGFPILVVITSRSVVTYRHTTWVISNVCYSNLGGWNVVEEKVLVMAMLTETTAMTTRLITETTNITKALTRTVFYIEGWNFFWRVHKNLLSLTCYP